MTSDVIDHALKYGGGRRSFLCIFWCLIAFLLT